MFRRDYLPEDMDDFTATHGSSALCRAIVEDTEDARQFSWQPRGALDLHSVMPCAPMEIRHGSMPLPSELTSLVA